MGGLQMYCNKLTFSVFTLILSLQTMGQGNCLAYPDNSGERIACELSYRAVTYKQGSAPSQVLFDRAIEVGPDYAYAYYEKSVPFFKRGMLVEATKLLNKAIELDPLNYLTYRAYWYFSHHSFEACISDLERFYNQLNGRLHPTPGGDFEMRMLLALSYAQTGQLEKGLALVDYALANYEDMGYFISPYDYHVSGLLYFFDGQYEKAQDQFEVQLQNNNRLADTYYYLWLCAEKMEDSDKAANYLQEALDRFDGQKDGFSFKAFANYNVSRFDVVSAMNRVAQVN